MSTMRRSAAGAGTIPVLTLPSGQASSLLANRATTVRGDLLRRDDLREFRSAYNRVAVSRSTLLRRIVASPPARPPPFARRNVAVAQLDRPFHHRLKATCFHTARSKSPRGLRNNVGILPAEEAAKPGLKAGPSQRPPTIASADSGSARQAGQVRAPGRLGVGG